MALPSTTIGNYRLLKELASGAFGRVYRAEHLYLTNHFVAVKLLHAHLASEKERQSFLHEAQILFMLKHTHILPVLDVGIHDNMPYMITEFASQGSLRDRLRAQSPHLLPQSETITILTQIAQALELAHQSNIVHRDLKPENILFDAKGNALLADFGISTILSSMSVNVATITGTPPYMAPEQFKGEISKESDQYALGCLAYELFTGRLPFIAPDFFSMAMKHMNELPPDPTTLNAQLPAHISQALLKALAKKRRQRHPDVMGFVSAIHPSSSPVQPSTTPTTESASAITLNPKAAEEYLIKGNDLYNLKRYEEAIVAYDHAIRLNPGYAYAYCNKGNALDDLKRYEEALAAYDQAIHLNPDFADAYYNKGNALGNLKHYEEALLAYDHAIRLNPKDASTYYNKGIALDALQHYEEAVIVYDHAIRFNPVHTNAYYNKGNALRNLKRYEEALVAYDHAIRLNPEYADAYNNKGFTLQKLKRYEEALVAYDQALRIDPQHQFAQRFKLIVLAELKRSR